MKVRLVIIILIILIVLVGAGVGWWFLKDKTTTNTNTTANNNQTINATNTPAVSLGALVVERDATYREINFSFSTASVEPTFNGFTAPDGKTYVIIYYRPIDGADKANSLPDWAPSEILLKADKDRSYTAKQVKVVTAAVGQTDEGYLWYEVDADAANFSLQFGQGEAPYVIKLNF